MLPFKDMPYQRIIIPDAESGTYSGKILEFPGCFAQGISPQDVYEQLDRVAESWIEAALDLGQKIPEPFIHLTTTNAPHSIGVK